MKSIFTIFCFFLVWNLSLGQEKLLKVLGGDLALMDPQIDYSWKPEGNVNFHASNTYLGDTTGASNNREFLLFRDDIVHEKKEVFKFFKESYVTNKEYQVFYDWVLDSLYREAIWVNNDPTGLGKIPDEDILKMLDFEDPFIDPETGELESINSEQYKMYRSYFGFDWEFDWRKKIDLDDYLPLIQVLNKRSHERFNRSKEIDGRKIKFAFDKDGTEYVNISRDHYLWALTAERVFDLPYNLANYYHSSSIYSSFPVQGLNGNQIRGYLTFLENQCQRRINKAKLPYRVQISLPTPSEIERMDKNYVNEPKNLIFKEMDMTSHWKITNSDYKEFVMAVQDSIIREILYMNSPDEGKELPMEDIAELLRYDDVYYDEVNLSWMEFDPADADINRSLFPLDVSFNWRKKFKQEDLLRFIKPMLSDTSNTDISATALVYNVFPYLSYYQYYWKDLNRAAQSDSLIWLPEYQQFICANGGDWYGRNLILSVPENQFWAGGVRRHENLSRFIIKERINIFPEIDCRDCNKICGNAIPDDDIDDRWPEVMKEICPDNDRLKSTGFYDFDSKPKALITSITYHQALAYYNWKYNRSTLQENQDPIYYNLLPSEEEFNKVQSGQKTLVQAQEIPYPTPVFRYVIHVFKK
ncbi:MAG: hypothetical protein MK105_15865 [Crocinitomicaceae bacterium]|nr:hypothetical protein [Crocinitomicaceae bacterium]